MVKLKIIAIKGILNKETEFNFLTEENTKKEFTSSSLIIQSCLFSAFIGNADVELDLVEGSEKIKRVYPFNITNKFPQFIEGDFSVARIATQRNSQTGLDHMEAFIKKRGQNEIAFNIENVLMQQFILNSFSISVKANNADYNLSLTFDKSDDKLITAAMIAKSI